MVRTINRKENKVLTIELKSNEGKIGYRNGCLDFPLSTAVDILFRNLICNRFYRSFYYLLSVKKIK
jgi:hypothetical protein